MKNIKPHCHIDCYCAVFVPGCLGPGCISGQKHQGSDETPLGRMQQTPCGLSPWADGRGNVGKSCGCCDDPCTAQGP